MEPEATDVRPGGERISPGRADFGAGSGPGSPDDQQHPGTRAVNHFRRSLDELKEQFSFYVAAKSDGLKYTAKKIGIYAGLGVVGLIAASAIVVTAGVLLLAGLADAINRLCGTGPWLGDLIVAVLVFGGIGLAAMIALKKIFNSSKKQTVERYEQRKRQQRAKFGQSVSDRAASAAASAKGK